MMGQMFVGLTLEDELVSSKHLIQVHLKILSRSVENMASCQQQFISVTMVLRFIIS